VYTWCVTLRDEHRLKVLKNRVLRKVSGTKREEVTRGSRKLHNGELHSVYSPKIIQVIKSQRP
jgi:hypothetical protein